MKMYTFYATSDHFDHNTVLDGHSLINPDNEMVTIPEATMTIAGSTWLSTK